MLPNYICILLFCQLYFVTRFNKNYDNYYFKISKQYDKQLLINRAQRNKTKMQPIAFIVGIPNCTIIYFVVSQKFKLKLISLILKYTKKNQEECFDSSEVPYSGSLGQPLRTQLANTRILSLGQLLRTQLANTRIQSLGQLLITQLTNTRILWLGQLLITQLANIRIISLGQLLITQLTNTTIQANNCRNVA